MFAQILLAVFVLLCTRALWMRWKYDLHKIPSPPAWPLVGHALLFLGGKGEKEVTYARAYWWKRLGWPQIIRLNFFGNTVLYVKDMDFARSVLMSKASALPKKFFSGLHNFLGGDPNAKSVVTLMTLSPYVKAVRRCYLSAFDSNNLKVAMSKTNRVIDHMIDHIEARRNKGALDVQKLCVRFTLDVIGQVAFGVNLGGLDGSRDLCRLLIEVGYISVDQLVNPFKTLYCSLFPHSSLAQRRTDTINSLKAEWDRIADDILGRDDPPEGEMPLWHALRKLVDPETGKELEYMRLRAELATVVVAAMDTTGHQLAWILALLAAHPHVTDNIVAQLKEKGLRGPDEVELSFEDLADLADLPYVMAVVREGMRICHVSQGAFPRVAEHDMTVLGYRVPKGTWISLVGTRWMHSEDDWEDPQVFKPERWLTDEDMSQKHYLGFSYGSRDCVGQRLAMMELRLAVIRLVQRYTFKLTVPFDDLMMRARNGLAIEAMDGIWMHMHPRTE